VGPPLQLTQSVLAYPGGVHKLLPVTVADRRILQFRDGLERRHHVLDGALDARVDVPRPHLLVEHLDVLAEPVAVDVHLLDVDLAPQRRLPVVDARPHDEDKVPQHLEQQRLAPARPQVFILRNVHFEEVGRLQQRRHHPLHRRQLSVVLLHRTISNVHYWMQQSVFMAPKL